MAGIDPDVQVLLDALEARITALEAAVVAPAHPYEVVEKYRDHPDKVYREV